MDKEGVRPTCTRIAAYARAKDQFVSHFLTWKEYFGPLPWVEFVYRNAKICTKMTILGTWWQRKIPTFCSPFSFSSIE